MQFESSYGAYVALLEAAVTSGLRDTTNLALATAATFAYTPAPAAGAVGAAAPWTAVFPAFEAYGQAAAALGGARTVMLLPFVGGGAERTAYDAFLGSHWAALAGPGAAALAPADAAALQARFAS